jgi:hypothetical protein
VRDGHWKLVTTKEETFLSHLSKDIGERDNLALQYPNVVDRLTALHDAWVIESVQQ